MIKQRAASRDRGTAPTDDQLEGASAQDLLGNAAMQELQSGGDPLPEGLLQQMEQSFGADFSGVRVHEGDHAETVGALAFAQGEHLHFQPGAYDPHSEAGRELIGHELAHVVQQGGSAGPPLRKGEVNAAPGLEAEADTLGARAAAGEPAQVRQSAPSGDVQRYQATPTTAQNDDWQAGVDLRISDDGNMATGEDGGYGSHAFWTLPGLIAESNDRLEANKSVIRLHATSDAISGPAPDGSGDRQLVAVEAENVATATQGDDMELWADCGRSFRDVVGIGEGTGLNYGDTAAVHEDRRTEQQPAEDQGWLDRLLVSIGLADAPDMREVEIVDETETAASSPSAMKGEIFSEHFSGGMADYQALSDDEREAFDERVGINRHAAPQVGEGYTMSTGGQNFPGQSTWNFHWAGVVMASGGDRVVLENYAVGDAEATNSDWEFQMYGPASKAGQTFHDQHLATQQHGREPTTMRVRHRT